MIKQKIQTFLWHSPIKTIYKKLFWRYKTWINFYPLFLCNYRCPYCVITNNEYDKKVKPRGTGEEWAESLNKFGKSFIGMCGGEPFLWKELEDFLSNVRKDTFVTIPTNGSIKINDSLMKVLSSKKNLTISVTWHPFGKMNIGEFIENVKVMQKEDIKVQSSAVAYPDDKIWHKLKDYNKLFKKEGIPFEIATYIFPEFNYTEEQKRYLIDEVGIPNPCRKEMFDFDSNPRKKTCVAGQKYLFIVPDGNVYICNSRYFCATSEFHKKYKIPLNEAFLGNVFDGFEYRKDGYFGNKYCTLPCSEACDRVWGNVKEI